MILLKRKSADVSPLNPLDSIKPVQSSTGPCPACRPAASLTSSPSLPAPLAQFPQVTGAHCSVAEPQALARGSSGHRAAQVGLLAHFL